MKALTPIFVSLLSILLFGSVPVKAADSANGTVKACDIQQLNVMLGTVALSLGNDKVVMGALPCLFSLWKEHRNKGSGGFYISNAFLYLAETNPGAFFRATESEPVVFDEWLKDLPDLSFTWSDAPPCGLEKRRKQLIAVLSMSGVSSPLEVGQKAALIKRLKATRCRQID
ncbi:MAG: hypothetical protein NT042_08590 [Sulfuritalea sp.]|nr:hypothetical protein [Sulfuritalea sp.]